jgi:hypothetical protein
MSKLTKNSRGANIAACTTYAYRSKNQFDYRNNMEQGRPRFAKPMIIASYLFRPVIIKSSLRTLHEI